MNLLLSQVTQPPIIYVDEPTAAATPVPTYPGPPAEPTVLPTPAPSKVPTLAPARRTGSKFVSQNVSAARSEP